LHRYIGHHVEHGSLADRNKTVAEVASKLFGASITEQDIIGETLERVTDPLKDVAAVQVDLAGAVARTQPRGQILMRFGLIRSIWVELNLGIELPDNEPPRRAKPMTIQTARKNWPKTLVVKLRQHDWRYSSFLWLPMKSEHHKGDRHSPSSYTSSSAVREKCSPRSKRRVFVMSR
jgi:hypothetical protein